MLVPIIPDTLLIFTLDSLFHYTFPTASLITFFIFIHAMYNYVTKCVRIPMKSSKQWQPCAASLVHF